MEANRLDAQVERYLEQVKVAEKNGNAVGEYTALKRAMELQANINEQYRHSPYASDQRLSELRDRLMKGKSVELQVELNQSLQRLDEVLRNRDWESVMEHVDEARAVLARFLSEYDRSFLDDKSVPERLDWLVANWEPLRRLVDDMSHHWVMVPGKDRLMILDREMTQGWYEVIVGENPSRHVGAGFPVESVSLAEARAFCRKLSWVMGQDVRLPKEEEVMAFAFCGMDGGWFSHNSGFETHEGKIRNVPAGVLPDLYGNVAEWLYADDMGAVFGGRGIDPAVVAQESPVESMDEDGRSRWVGFRVVLTSGDAAE